MYLIPHLGEIPLAGSYHTVGVTAAGRAVAVGNKDSGQCDVAHWREIVAVAAGSTDTLGLRADGTVVAAGNNKHGQCDITGWTSPGPVLLLTGVASAIKPARRPEGQP